MFCPCGRGQECTGPVSLCTCGYERQEVQAPISHNATPAHQWDKLRLYLLSALQVQVDVCEQGFAVLYVL